MRVEKRNFLVYVTGPARDISDQGDCGAAYSVGFKQAGHGTKR